MRKVENTGLNQENTIQSRVNKCNHSAHICESEGLGVSKLLLIGYFDSQYGVLNSFH